MRITVQTLLKNGTSQREIERVTGVDRKTIRRYAREAKSPGVATGSEAAGSVKIPHPGHRLWRSRRARCTGTWIEAQVQLGRNAMSIYQDLVELHGFDAPLQLGQAVRARAAKAASRSALMCWSICPGEEAQVDYGQGALTRLRERQVPRPYLFVMTLKYSGKSFRKVVWKTDQEIWARLHEEACAPSAVPPGTSCSIICAKAVITPDLYEPALNPVYAAMLAHYGVVADACRVADPDRKGTVERAIQHTQATALKGRQVRVHRGAERLARALGGALGGAAHPRAQETPGAGDVRRGEAAAGRAAAEGLRYFEQGTRTVDDAGAVQVGGSYYAAVPGAALQRGHRAYLRARDRDPGRATAPCCAGIRRSTRKGHYEIPERGPDLQSLARDRAAARRRPQDRPEQPRSSPSEIFARLGRPGQKALYGLTNLPRHYSARGIEAACARVLSSGCVSYQTRQTHPRASSRQTRRAPAPRPTPKRTRRSARSMTTSASGTQYTATSTTEELNDAHVDHRT